MHTSISFWGFHEEEALCYWDVPLYIPHDALVTNSVRPVLHYACLLFSADLNDFHVVQLTIQAFVEHFCADVNLGKRKMEKRGGEGMLKEHDYPYTPSPFILCPWGYLPG